MKKRLNPAKRRFVFCGGKEKRICKSAAKKTAKHPHKTAAKEKPTENRRRFLIVNRKNFNYASGSVVEVVSSPLPVRLLKNSMTF